MVTVCGDVSVKDVIPAASNASMPLAAPARPEPLNASTRPEPAGA